MFVFYFLTFSCFINGAISASFGVLVSLLPRGRQGRTRLSRSTRGKKLQISHSFDCSRSKTFPDCRPKKLLPKQRQFSSKPWAMASRKREIYITRKFVTAGSRCTRPSRHSVWSQFPWQGERRATVNDFIAGYKTLIQNLVTFHKTNTLWQQNFICPSFSFCFRYLRGVQKFLLTWSWHCSISEEILDIKRQFLWAYTQGTFIF